MKVGARLCSDQSHAVANTVKNVNISFTVTAPSQSQSASSANSVSSVPPGSPARITNKSTMSRSPLKLKSPKHAVSTETATDCVQPASSKANWNVYAPSSNSYGRPVPSAEPSFANQEASQVSQASPDNSMSNPSHVVLTHVIDGDAVKCPRPRLEELRHNVFHRFWMILVEDVAFIHDSFS